MALIVALIGFDNVMIVSGLTLGGSAR